MPRVSKRTLKSHNWRRHRLSLAVFFMSMTTERKRAELESAEELLLFLTGRLLQVEAEFAALVPLLLQHIAAFEEKGCATKSAITSNVLRTWEKKRRNEIRERLSTLSILMPPRFTTYLQDHFAVCPEDPLEQPK